MISACDNPLYCLSPSGYVGRRLAAHETTWLQHVLERNPNLFEAFAHPDDNRLHKSQWHGEYPGKLLTGMAQCYRMRRDPATREAGDELVRRFQAVQGEDGYLGPWSHENRLDGDKDKWDTWGIYHCVYGLYQWYRVTGSQTALETALRAADQVCRHFIAGGRPFVGQNWVEMNFAISHAFALLYQETGEPRYREAAAYIVDREWKMPYDDYFSKSVIACDWLDAGLAGVPFYRTNQPRWEAQHTLMTLAPLYEITGDDRYYRAFENLWQSIVRFDRHNFGGFGTGEGAEGKPFTGGSETCNTVAWMAWTTEYLKLSRNPAAADELELSNFNAAWGSLIGDVWYTYMNVMSGERILAPDILGPAGFEGGTEMSCCQTNGARGISQVAEWAVLTGDGSLYLNYYGPCDAQARTPGGSRLGIRQETAYPAQGRIAITLSLDQPERFPLHLRIPGWSEKTALSVNGEPVERPLPGRYVVLDRQWREGDRIDLELDMTLHYLEGEEECAGKWSIYRGPLLLARSWKKEEPPAPGSLTLTKEELAGLERVENPALLLRVRTAKGTELVSYCDAWEKGKLYETWFPIV